MTEDTNVTRRSAYQRGQADGVRDAQAGSDYRPRDGRGSYYDQYGYGLGYEAGWNEGNPCTNGTCDHLAHHQMA